MYGSTSPKWTNWAVLVTEQSAIYTRPIYMIWIDFSTLKVIVSVCVWVRKAIGIEQAVSLLDKGHFVACVLFSETSASTVVYDHKKNQKTKIIGKMLT